MPPEPGWVELGPCSALWLPGDEDKAAVVLPGGRGAGAQPVLAFARMVLQERGWSVLVVWDEITDLDCDDVTRHQWAIDRALAALDWIAVPHVLFVGKSLSSFAAGVAADRGLPALWYTPLLSVPIIVSDLRRGRAALALVGGTADDFWLATTARETGAAILELEGVDHSLELQGDALGSVRVLERVTRFTAEFVASVARA